MTVTKAQGKSADWESGRDIKLPFTLELSSGNCVVCQQILRLLPARRLVCRAVQNDRVLLLKLFMGNKCRIEAEEDSRGVNALAEAGIATPKLIELTSVSGKGYPVLLFEYLDHARDFREVWEQADGRVRGEMLGALLEMVAVQHMSGLRQRDFHLRNFIVNSTNRIFAIDGGDYSVSRRQVGKYYSLKNLGMLFGHLPVDQLPQQRRLLEAYFKLRGWRDYGRLYRKVLSISNRFRRRRARVISSKAFRNCSEFCVRRSGRLLIYQQREFPSAELDHWIQNTGLDLTDRGSVMLKDGNSQTVWKTRIGEREVVVKRYNLKSWWHALKRAISRSRASRSWQNAYRLRAYHIPTPQPLAMIEERRGPFRGRAWLLTSYSKGTKANLFFDSAIDEKQLSWGVEALADMVYRFAANGLVHGDLKATNLILGEEGVQVIDLDSMFQPVMPGRREREISADRERFLANWSDYRLRRRFAARLEAFNQA